MTGLMSIKGAMLVLSFIYYMLMLRLIGLKWFCTHSLIFVKLLWEPILDSTQRTIISEAVRL